MITINNYENSKISSHLEIVKNYLISNKNSIISYLKDNHYDLCSHKMIILNKDFINVYYYPDYNNPNLNKFSILYLSNDELLKVTRFSDIKYDKIIEYTLDNLYNEYLSFTLTEDKPNINILIDCEPNINILPAHLFAIDELIHFKQNSSDERLAQYIYDNFELTDEILINFFLNDDINDLFLDKKIVYSTVKYIDSLIDYFKVNKCGDFEIVYKYFDYIFPVIFSESMYDEDIFRSILYMKRNNINNILYISLYDEIKSLKKEKPLSIFNKKSKLRKLLHLKKMFFKKNTYY